MNFKVKDLNKFRANYAIMSTLIVLISIFLFFSAASFASSHLTYDTSNIPEANDDNASPGDVNSGNVGGDPNATPTPADDASATPTPANPGESMPAITINSTHKPTQAYDNVDVLVNYPVGQKPNTTIRILYPNNILAKELTNQQGSCKLSFVPKLPGLYPVKVIANGHESLTNFMVYDMPKPEIKIVSPGKVPKVFDKATARVYFADGKKPDAVISVYDPQKLRIAHKDFKPSSSYDLAFRPLKPGLYCAKVISAGKTTLKYFRVNDISVPSPKVTIKSAHTPAVVNDSVEVSIDMPSATLPDGGTINLQSRLIVLDPDNQPVLDRQSFNNDIKMPFIAKKKGTYTIEVFCRGKKITKYLKVNEANVPTPIIKIECINTPPKLRDTVTVKTVFPGAQKPVASIYVYDPKKFAAAKRENVKDNYDIKFMPDTPGLYVVKVISGGKTTTKYFRVRDISVAPPKVTINSPHDPAVVNDTIEIVVDLPLYLRKEGGSVTLGGTVKVMDPDNQHVLNEEIVSGISTLNFAAKKEGTYTIEVTCKGKQVTKYLKVNPFKQMV